jgi:hypothetical protein
LWRYLGCGHAEFGTIHDTAAHDNVHNAARDYDHDAALDDDHDATRDNACSADNLRDTPHQRRGRQRVQLHSDRLEPQR